MADNLHEPEILEPGAVPAQPDAQESRKFNLKVVGGIAAVILVIGACKPSQRHQTGPGCKQRTFHTASF